MKEYLDMILHFLTFKKCENIETKFQKLHIIGDSNK